jgi:hypothetical protein
LQLARVAELVESVVYVHLNGEITIIFQDNIGDFLDEAQAKVGQPPSPKRANGES